jgi:hypothetical protein
MTEKDELATTLQSLKQHPGWTFICQILTNWKNQASTELAETPHTDPRMPSIQADYKAYARLLKLPDQLLHDLTDRGFTVEDLDAYK